jgi:hypothetical protein
MRLNSLTRGVLVLLGGVLVAGAAGSAEVPRTSVDKSAANETAEDRARRYHLSEGSEIFPANWLAALESRTTGKLFLDETERFGLLPDPNGPEVFGPPGRSWRLPVGITLAKPKNSSVQMVGVNCAACHVGEIRVDGTAIRIDGGPNLFNLDGFYQELFESAKETVSSPSKMVAFVDRMRQARGERDELSAFLEKLGEGLKREESLAQNVLARARAILEDRDQAPPAHLKLLHALHAGNLQAAIKSVIDHDPDFVKRLESRIPSLISLEKLRVRVRESSAIPGSFAEALAGLGDDRLLFLEARLAFLKRLKGLHDVPGGGKALVPGPGRIDAIINARELVFPRDAITPNSAVSFPPIWNLRQIKWFHYDGDTTSLIDRNVAQAMGLGAVVIPESGASTLLPRNLHELEILNGQLTPAKWTELIGPFRPDEIQLARSGESLYRQNCARCHEGPPPDGAPLLVEEHRPFRFPVFDVGTDPQRWKNFAVPMKDGQEFAKVLQSTLGQIKARAYDENHVSSDEQAAMEPKGGVRWVTTQGYVVRPLAGVWATAPYLHNASVPTLDDLLKSSEQRPKEFLVGYRGYDTDRVGYISDPVKIPDAARKGLFKYDTSLQGNSNAGHEYGARFDESQRKAILAYLKTL